MATQERQHWCARCGEYRLFRKRTRQVPHSGYIMATLFCCGLAIPFWVLDVGISMLAGIFAPFICTRCGSQPGRAGSGRRSSPRLPEPAATQVQVFLPPQQQIMPAWPQGMQPGIPVAQPLWPPSSSAQSPGQQAPGPHEIPVVGHAPELPAPDLPVIDVRPREIRGATAPVAAPTGAPPAAASSPRESAIVRRARRGAGRGYMALREIDQSLRALAGEEAALHWLCRGLAVIVGLLITWVGLSIALGIVRWLARQVGL